MGIGYELRQKAEKANDGLMKFLWDAGKEVAGDAVSVATDVATGVGEGVVGTFDFLGDVASETADFLGNTKRFSEGEGFLDKFAKENSKNSQDLRDFVRTNVGGRAVNSDIGKGISDTIVGGSQIAGGLIGPGALAKAGSILGKASKFIPYIDKLDDAKKVQVVNEMMQLKKSGNLTKEGLQAIADKYNPGIVSSLKETIGKSAIPKEMKDMIATITPAVEKSLKETSPKIYKMLNSPELLANWVKQNPKKAISLFGSMSVINTGVNKYEDVMDDGTGTESMLPPQTSVIKEIEDSLPEDKDENSIQYGPTKSSKDTPAYLKGPSLENKDVKGGDTVTPDNKEGTDPQLSKYKEGTIGANVERQMDEGSNLNLKESVADTMRAVGIENGFQGRQRIFEQLFNEPYRGTAEQNIKLREKIKDYSPEEIIDIMKKGYTMTM